MVAFYDIMRRAGFELLNIEPHHLSPDIVELELRYLRHFFSRRARRRSKLPPLLACRMRKDDRDTD